MIIMLQYWDGDQEQALALPVGHAIYRRGLADRRGQAVPIVRWLDARNRSGTQTSGLLGTSWPMRPSDQEPIPVG
jgi:hypothetical protein